MLRYGYSINYIIIPPFFLFGRRMKRLVTVRLCCYYMDKIIFSQLIPDFLK